MLLIPDHILTQYDATLLKRSIPALQHAVYKKWLRYYLDFCGKYPVPDSKAERVRLFIDKLREKKQTSEQQKQAAHAVALYFELLQQAGEPAPRPPVTEKLVAPVPQKRLSLEDAGGGPVSLQQAGEPAPRPPVTEKLVAPVPQKRLSLEDAGGGPVSLVQSSGWEKVHGDLAAEIKTRHYSPKTLKAYALWTRQFQRFLRSRPPQELSSVEVKAYLTYLAVKCNVSASTQNQAFNALLFLFRHVLKQDFGDHRDIPRARRTKYIPVVLARQEIDAVLKHLSPPYDLVVKLLYGCGLRLFEGLKLRLQHFNFDAGILTIHDGKGKKDRTVPIPQSILPELKEQLERVMKLHDQDMAAGYAGVFLDGLLEKKYPAAPRELVWQWFFPAKTLTLIPGQGKYRRYHLHESHVQKAIRAAVRQARLLKRVSAHTFRHSFATHLLQANYDIRTIQELLGHSDVRTTMIYTHTIQSRTVKEAKSPLDF